jgi:hypothetical protein
MKLTKTEIVAMNPCRDGLDFCESCEFDIVRIYNTCERGDWLIWLLCHTKQLDKPKSVAIAIACAEMVIDIFENKYPDDKRPRTAIDAAKKWLIDPNEKNRKAAADSANAAADAATYAAYAAAATYAAYAAAVAYAADAVAYAAYAAANAATYAAYAAAAAYADAVAYAADAVAYAAAADAATYAAYAAAARKDLLKKQADKIREIVPCPFTK